MPCKRADEAAARAMLDLMQARLGAQRESISRELCAIPPPVPACDVNFNRLLEERARIVDELQALARLRAAGANAAAVLSFCRASCGLDGDAKAVIEAELRQP